MTVNAADSLERLVNRERLFVWLRFTALLLVGAYFVIDPRPQLASLSLTLNVFLAAALANVAGWLLLRLHRFARWVAILGAALDAALLFYALVISGGPDSPLWPLTFVLIAATTLRFGLAGGGLTAIVFSAFQIYNAVQLGSSDRDRFDADVSAVMFVGMALLVGRVMRFEQRQNLRENEQALIALQHSQGDVKAFAEMSGAMSANTNYEVTLRRMLDLTMRGLRQRGQTNDTMAGMILLFDLQTDDALVEVVQSQFGPPDEQKRLTPIAGGIKTVITTADPLLLRDARRDPLLCQFQIVEKYHSVAILPLRAGLTMFGVAVFAGTEKLIEVVSQRLELMEAYTNQAAIAIQNAQLFAQLSAERNNIIDSEEKVRHELARDLHDGPVNQVASLAMGLDFARRLLEKEPAKAAEELSNLHKLATKTARDMRLTMYRLRPLALETAGLSTALDQYLGRLRAENSRPAFHYSASPPENFEPHLSSNAATMVFDILKEAISNSLKHAGAENIWVDLRAGGNWLVASARDDGKGFDVGAVQAGYATRGSLGMINIQERAELAQGEATIDSARGRGTTVTVRVPLNS